MGYHYANLDLIASGANDPAHPPILVYVPSRHGQLRLGAVEYFHVDADQDLSTFDDRPMLFAKYPFNGPMLGHGPGQPIHDDLHLWLYKRNPAGQMEPWNPRVHCPES